MVDAATSSDDLQLERHDKSELDETRPQRTGLPLTSNLVSSITGLETLRALGLRKPL